MVALAGVAVWLAVDAGTVAGATTRSTRLPGIDAQCGAVGAVRPKTIVLACGDGNAVATALHWSTWSRSRAEATGVLKQNTCHPDCADGTFKSYPATFTLFDVVRTDSRRYFVKITIAFTHASPLGHRSETVSDCYVNPSQAGMPKCPVTLGLSG
jgi:hypothetical protein